MQLRPYQQRAVDEVRVALADHRAVVLALQVGGGKTVVACEMIRLALQRGRRALFVVHRIELVQQARERLARFGINAGIIKAGITAAPARPVQVACVPTLIRRRFPAADLVIFDETHHVVSGSWLRVLHHYREAGAWVVGITATPVRLDGRGLGEAFSTIVEPVTTRELIDGGFLLEPIVYAPPVDLAGLRVTKGDYALPELAERMTKLCGNLVDHWMEHGRGRPTVAFAVNIEHSRRIEEAFLEAGVKITHVDGKSAFRDRMAANRALRTGELEIVTQCQLWTEGVDIPELGCLVIARPTKSLGLHRQMIGRVMRTSPGKLDCVVLDHAGNHHKHGAITAPVEWSLDEKKRRQRTTAGCRTCLNCYAVLPPMATECPQCGAPVERRADADLPPVDAPGQLVRFLGPTSSPAEKAQEYRRLVETASVKGYRLGWARRQYQERFLTWPRLSEIEAEVYRCSGHEWEVREYGPKKVKRCVRCYEEGAWDGRTVSLGPV